MWPTDYGLQDKDYNVTDIIMECVEQQIERPESFITWVHNNHFIDSLIS